MNGQNGRQNKKIILIVGAVILALILTALTILIVSKFAGGTNTPDTSSVSGSTGETSGRDDEWDRALIRWKPETLLDLELRVKPGYEYDLVTDEYHGCTFTSADQTEVYLDIQGLDYGNGGYEALIDYFKKSEFNILYVGKTSKFLIMVWDQNKTETVSQLDGITCLTAKGSDSRAISEFFSTVMIRVNGEDYFPFTEKEGYDGFFPENDSGYVLD